MIGLLDDVPTPTGYVITPVVARAPGDVALVPSEREVAELLVADVGALAAPASYQRGEERRWLGMTFVMHEYRFAGHRIWGATARILHQLLDLAALQRADPDGAP